MASCFQVLAWSEFLLCLPLMSYGLGYISQINLLLPKLFFILAFPHKNSNPNYDNQWDIFIQVHIYTKTPPNHHGIHEIAFAAATAFLQWFGTTSLLCSSYAFILTLLQTFLVVVSAESQNPVWLSEIRLLCLILTLVCVNLQSTRLVNTL